jgi:hypothetical protein
MRVISITLIIGNIKIFWRYTHSQVYRSFMINTTSVTIKSFGFSRKYTHGIFLMVLYHGYIPMVRTMHMGEQTRVPEAVTVTARINN